MSHLKNKAIGITGKTMKFTATVASVIASLIWCGICPVSADNSPILSQTSLSVDYNQMVERIEAAHTSKDTEKMKILAKEIQSKWSKTDIQYYGRLMDKLCYAILTPNTSQQNPRAAITEKYAILALKRRHELPVLMEADFVSYLLPQEGKIFSSQTLKGDDWVSYRSVRAAIALHILGRIEKETDQNFDFSKVPLLQVSPPLAAGVDSGTSLEGVADPKLRAEYEARIKANDAINDKLMLRRHERLQRVYWFLMFQVNLSNEFYGQAASGFIRRLSDLLVRADHRDRVLAAAERKPQP